MLSLQNVTAGDVAKVFESSFSYELNQISEFEQNGMWLNVSKHGRVNTQFVSPDVDLFPGRVQDYQSKYAVTYWDVMA